MAYRDCSRTCIFDHSTQTVTENKEHSHVPNQEKTEVEKMVAEMKDKAGDDNDFQPIQIYRERMAQATVRGWLLCFLHMIRLALLSIAEFANNCRHVPPMQQIWRFLMSIIKHALGRHF